jgi:hypothetical protein
MVSDGRSQLKALAYGYAAKLWIFIVISGIKKTSHAKEFLSG